MESSTGTGTFRTCTRNLGWYNSIPGLQVQYVRNTKNQITYRSIIDTITLLQPYLVIRSNAYRLYEIQRRCIMDMCDNYSNTVSACLCS